VFEEKDGVAARPAAQRMSASNRSSLINAVENPSTIFDELLRFLSYLSSKHFSHICRSPGCLKTINKASKLFKINDYYVAIVAKDERCDNQLVNIWVRQRIQLRQSRSFPALPQPTALLKRLFNVFL
jgi:hypothetical protein